MTEIERNTQRWWDRFAEQDPHYFTYPLASHAEYFATGIQTIGELLARHAPAAAPRRRALDIGCGLGRLTFALCDHFEHVVGIDISDQLLGHVREHQRQHAVANLTTLRVDEGWESSGPYDFILSLFVMQHVSSWPIIESYLDAVGRTLAPRGVGILSFDTRPSTLGYRLRRHLPGFLAPRQLKPGYRRIRRSPAQLRDRFERAGLRIVHNEGAGTTYDLYVVERADTDQRATRVA